MLGTLAGSMLPFILRRLGFDLAASSSPFVATLVDVTGLCIYFLAALVILWGTLLWMESGSSRLHLSRSRRMLSAMTVRASEEQGMPTLSVPIEHNVNSDRACERG